MNSKSFLFISAWIQPLKSLPLAERWKVLEAIVEYATTGHVCETLTPMEAIAFCFIRNEIDRMKQYRSEKSRVRGKAVSSHSDKVTVDTKQPETEIANNASDANACQDKHHDAPYHNNISESESKSESESEKTSSSTSSGSAHEREEMPGIRNQTSGVKGKIPNGFTGNKAPGIKPPTIQDSRFIRLNSS